MKPQLSILLVERDSIALLALTKNLEDLGFTEILVAKGKTDAHDILANKKVDLIFFDPQVYAPNDLRQWLNKNLIHVLALVPSGYSDQNAKITVKNQEVGVEDVLLKPFNYDQLQSLMVKWA